MVTLRPLRSALALAAPLVPQAVSAQYFNDFESPPHRYWTAEVNDPMSKLVRRLEAGELKLEEEPGLPLLRRVLKELEVPEESQVLVFSKTSLQRRAVSGSNPRAVYFNDQTFVGWMPGGRIEISSADPRLGSVFYIEEIERRPDSGAGFERSRRCIGCHAGSATNFLPGPLGRSVYPDSEGRPLRSVDTFERIGHAVPLQERWGGWFVSGHHPGITHMGNAFAKPGRDGVELDRDQRAQEGDLGAFFDQDKFLRPGSDVVALLVLDHQVSMEFELMEANYIARQAIADAGWREGELPAQRPEAFEKELAAAADRVVGYMLFQNEAPLGDRPIQGGADFQEAFMSAAQTDPEGRSLRDFHLDGRLFKHRCSYMIHSPSFGGLPAPLKEAVFARLREVLADGEPVDGYAHLPEAERRAIREILAATVEGFHAE